MDYIISKVTNTPEILKFSLVLIFICLGFSSFAWRFLRDIRPNWDYTELYLRIRTWWFIIIGLAICIIGGETVTISILCLASWVGFKEFLSAIPTRKSDHTVLLWAYLSIPIQFYWIYIGWYGMFSIFIPVYVFLFITMRATLTGETNNFLHAVGSIHWGLMTTVYCLSHLAFLTVLPSTTANANTTIYSGLGLMFFIILTTQSNDIFQYLAGKLLGKHKIVPKVSPKKTWEGFLGGVILTSSLFYFIGSYFTPLKGYELILGGIVTSVAGFIGDIVMSSVKRDIGIKDYGTILPGHGGVMDRMDSLVFTAPLFFHYLRYIHY